MGNSLGRRLETIQGEIVEVRRSGGELCVDWKIPGFLDLPGRGLDSYDSPLFGFHDARWHLRVWPHFYSSRVVSLSLRRDVDDGGPSTRRVIFSTGLRVSGGGVEMRGEEEEREFGKGCGWTLGVICSRYELRKQEDILMPGGTLTLVCQMKVSGTAATGSSPHQGASIQTDGQFREPGTLTGGSQTQQGELTSSVLVTYSYKELQKATQNFGDLPLRSGGCKIGEGGFGTVYRAVIGDDVVAVKRLKDPVDKQFMTELMTLTNYKHENVLALFGCCLGPPNCCLLYEYMPNGSLEDRLACVVCKKKYLS